MQKILVVGIEDFSFLAQNFFQTVKINFPKSEFHNVKKYRKIVKYINKDFDLNLFNKRLFRLKPDLIFIIAPYYINKKYYEIIEDYKNKHLVVVSGWIGDKFIKNQTNHFISTVLDKKFITDSYFYNLFENNSNTTYLPLCTSSSIFYKSNYKKRFFSTFIASQTPYRETFIEKLNFPLEVYGSGWKNLKKINTNTNLNINAKKLSIHKVSKIYNYSDTVLNLTNENNIVYGLNQRSFDPFLCNSLVLQENCKDLELSFEPNKEIIVFNTQAELEEKVNKFSKDKKSFYEILERGRRRVQSEHTFEHRLTKMINIIENK